MNKKLILLMLILPLLIMLSIYTSTNTVTININVPVSKIEVAGEKIVYLNLDTNEKYKVNYTVYPITAANKKINFTTEKVGTQPFADLEFEDGYIVPKSAGVARVYLTTVDGGYKANFIVYVESTSVKSIECSVETSELMVGDTTKITTMFYPENAKNKMLVYASSNPNVASVNNKGVIRGEGKGQATITITSTENSSIIDTVIVNVYNQDIMDLVQNQVYTYSTSGSVNLLAIDTDEKFEISYKVYDINNVLLTEDVFEQANLELASDDKHYLFNYTFKNNFIGSVIVKFTITTDNEIREPLTKECVFHKVEKIEASFDNENEVLSCYVGDWVTLHDKITVTPENVNVTYLVADTNNYCEIVELSENIVVKANLPGKTTIKLSVVSQNPEQIVVLEKDLVILPKYIGFKEYFGDSNIEGIWSVGKYEADGTNNTSKIALDLGYETENNFANYVTFNTNNSNVEISSNGLINIKNESFTDVVEVEAVFNYQGVTTKSNEKLKVRCVGNGYNVRSFKDLYSVTNNNNVVVLQNNVVDDFGYIDTDNDGSITDESLVYTPDTVKKIESTYDTSFYQTKPTVMVLVEFKSSVFGNGFEINSHNASCMLDATGNYKEDALFKGPLDFVSMAESADSSGSVARVKAQDNICFGVYENVTLTNIKLSGCKLQPDSENGYDLDDLKYVGTTVEVLGDNVNINYSRILNGRTVLRVFGDIEDSTKVINLNIKNSELSNAKEFIIRMGSNCFVDGTKEIPAPYINNDTSVTFPTQKTYSAMTNEQKTEYDNNYIKTYVNLKNTILKNSGLFCIGIDAHFSGDALAGGIISTWQDLAKTSYGAKLSLDGDVRMYDWKKINNIDSSTLIEISGNVDPNSTFAKLKFDVKEMIELLANDTKNTGLNKIVWKDSDNTQYVHGGIAFFGGGKNYGVAELKNYTFEPLVGYSVGLEDVNKELLELAAGNEDFYFLLNDSTSTEFLPTTQDTMSDDLLYKE